MNPDSENFDSLRRLLAIKRHEQPPPGYFNRFSRDVMARIKAGETGGEMAFEPSWIHRLLAMFDVKPVFAGAFGTAVCALLISGVISTEHGATSASSSAPAAGGGSFVANASPASPEVVPADLALTTVNTNPLVSTSGSLFDEYQRRIGAQLAQPVSEKVWVPNGN